MGILLALLWGLVQGLAPLFRGESRAQALLGLLKGVQGNRRATQEHEGSEVFESFITRADGAFTLKDHLADFDAEDLWSDARSGERFWLEQGPSVFVAAGIFFTFLGIMFGLWGLKLDVDPAALQASIGELVGGLSTAFISSLAGVFSSVIFTRARTHLQRNAQVATDKLRRQLIEEGRLLTPESLLHKLLLEQEKATRASTESKNALVNLIDIANGVDGKVGQLATDIAEKVSMQLGARMEGIVSQQLASPLASIQESFNDFASGQVASQSDTLAAVVQSFVEQLQSELHGHFEELAVALRETRAWYEQTHSIYRETGESLGVHVALQRDQLEAERTFFTGMRGDLGLLAEHREKLTEVETGLLKRLTDTLQHARSIEEEARGALNSLEMTANHIEASSKSHQDAQRSILEQTDQIITQMNSYTKQVSGVNDAFRASIDQLRKDLGEGLTTTFGSFDEGTAQVVNHLNGSFTLLKQSSTSLDATLGSLNASLAGLQGVLGQLPHAVAASVQSGLQSAGNGTQVLGTVPRSPPLPTHGR